LNVQMDIDRSNDEDELLQMQYRIIGAEYLLDFLQIENWQLDNLGLRFIHQRTSTGEFEILVSA